jgi:hypothetical protein
MSTQDWPCVVELWPSALAEVVAQQVPPRRTFDILLGVICFSFTSILSIVPGDDPASSPKDSSAIRPMVIIILPLPRSPLIHSSRDSSRVLHR